MLSIRQRGFTLIELLVVIAIIGILSSVVLASLNSARVKSRDSRRISDIKQIQLALELYYDSNGQYPTQIYGSPSPLVDGDHIAAVPTDPNTGNNYMYAHNSPQTDYHIGANLEQTDHQALDSDIDFDSASAGWTDGFNGTNDSSNGVYDMKP